MSMRRSFSSIWMSDVVRFGQDGDGSGRGVDTALRFRLGHALDAVDAAFVLEAAVCAAAAHFEDDLLEAAEVALVGVEDFDRPAVALGVAAVHAVEVAGEERCFVAAGGGTDLDDDVFFVERVFRDEGAAESFFEKLQA